jgi:rare lipoprotein A (peptidoglycan hydrolase)
MTTFSTISFCARIFNLWFLHLGSALVFLLSPFAPASAAPRLAQKVSAALAAKPPAGTGVLVQQRGIASWYGRHWQGRRTASGARFDDQALTAASLSLPLATRARVTNLRNGESVDVVVNDRGPYHRDRIIDLSARAAQVIGMKRCGIAPVLVQAVLVPQPQVVARIAMQ